MRSHHRLLAGLIVLPVLGIACTSPPPAALTPESEELTQGVRVEAPEPTLAPTTEPATPAPTTTEPQAPPPPTTKPPTPAPPTSEPQPFGAAFAGDVAPGFVRWGAAIGGNADPARHESHVDGALGLRRTFFGWRHIDSNYLRNTAAGDLAAGRLPWVSIKTLGNWAEVAAGQHDAALNKLIAQMKALPGPVWFTVHHEPENETNAEAARNGRNPHGTTADWRGMQAHVRELIDASGATNIAFAPILMSWTFDSRSNRNPEEWWVPGIWDFAGIDHYINDETATSVAGSARWQHLVQFYRARGLGKIAVGEWGNRGTDNTAAAEMQDFYDHALRSGSTDDPQIIGLAYFDSNVSSSTGGWELAGQPLQRFRQLMTRSTSLGAFQDGW